VPVDAEEWLARQGVQREPLRVQDDPSSAAAAAPGPSVREVVDLARQVTQERAAVPHVAAVPAVAEPSDDEADTGGMADTAEAAFTFLVRSTTNAPQSEGRLRGKLLDRGVSPEVIDRALERARTAGVVDDIALLGALIAERRGRGHADRRLRRDLRDRGFSGEQVDAALAQHAEGDPGAAAFALAISQAERQRGVDAEVAVRRIVGHLLRRGHSDPLARKAARDAVYADREAQQVAER
jgi:regulatory protein